MISFVTQICGLDSQAISCKCVVTAVKYNKLQTKLRLQH